ncbi:MAG: hypothetical protein NTY48_02335 [Candidatus Diapherotrites archaeon]|nr:hypothetical protein [Candidatus Diapherotrites archaeon]
MPLKRKSFVVPFLNKEGIESKVAGHLKDAGVNFPKSSAFFGLRGLRKVKFGILLDEITTKERAVIVQESIAKLEPVETKAVELVFGFSEAGAVDKAVAAKQMGLSLEDFNILLSVAIAKLASNKKLKEFV